MHGAFFLPAMDLLYRELSSFPMTTYVHSVLLPLSVLPPEGYAAGRKTMSRIEEDG